jgi:S-adenosylmethionine-diacylglycerol 3-amino-3-carboxypropyl transferase
MPRDAAPVAYAVIREDPRLEGDLAMRTSAESLLCVASGGCVALSLASRFPRVAVTAFDTDAAQIDHMARKADAAMRRDYAALNVENASSEGLNQAGELEKVFRLLRAFFDEFIAPHDERLAFFTRRLALSELDSTVRAWTTSRYWLAAFHACFSDVLLRTTLGSAPASFADVGGQPEYFARAFARGFRRDAAPENPFLQHVFLGGYDRECAPYYIRNPAPFRVEPVHGRLADVPRLERFRVVSLSNLMDHVPEAELAATAELLKAKLRPGSAILMRQLNSTRKLRPSFEPEFVFDDVLGGRYFRRERSLFYNRIEVGFRR